jgi:hypothetical protein
MEVGAVVEGYSDDLPGAITSGQSRETNRKVTGV